MTWFYYCYGDFIEKKGLEVKKGGIKGDSSETIFDD